MVGIYRRRNRPVPDQSRQRGQGNLHPGHLISSDGMTDFLMRDMQMGSALSESGSRTSPYASYPRRVWYADAPFSRPSHLHGVGEHPAANLNHGVETASTILTDEVVIIDAISSTLCQRIVFVASSHSHFLYHLHQNHDHLSPLDHGMRRQNINVQWQVGAVSFQTPTNYARHDTMIHSEFSLGTDPRHLHNYHYVSPLDHGLRGQNIDIQQQAAAASYQGQTNYAQHDTLNHSEYGLERDPRHHHNYHYLSALDHGVRGQNINNQQQAASAPYQVQTNYAQHDIMNPSEYRHLGPTPTTGTRIYNLYQQPVAPDTEFAISYLPEYYEAGDYMDNLSDMMNIDDMSYEQMLALQELIANHANIGLTEETILRKLKTTFYSTSAPHVNQEEATSVDEEPDRCTICQEEYQNQEKIGILDCGHEYHAECLKNWLIVKNICPLCKSEALTS